MIWILITLALLLTPIVYLLFASVYLEVDSIKGVYGIRVDRVARARFNYHEGHFFMDLDILNFKKSIELKPGAKASAGKSTSIKKKTYKKPSFITFRLMKQLFRTFKIIKCEVSVDTGDVVVNAVLYPFFLGISRWSHHPVAINYDNNNKVIMEIENKAIRLIHVFIFNIFTFKNK